LRKRYSSLSGQFWLFHEKGKQYEVIGQFDQQDRSKPLDLTSMYVKTAKAI
jgi:HAE1 family hydrophobic/amphiphilic exporter-1/multidrug efflux pump